MLHQFRINIHIFIYITFSFQEQYLHSNINTLVLNTYLVMCVHDFAFCLEQQVK